MTGVAEVNAAARAGINTGWGKTHINPLSAQVALLGYSFKLHGTKWTGINAIFAACAKRFVDQNNAVLSFGYGVYQAGVPASRLATMHTVNNTVSELLFTLYDAGGICMDSYPSWSNGQVMRLLTGDLTGTTADTIRSINDKGKFFYHLSSLAVYIRHIRTLRLVAPIAGS